MLWLLLIVRHWGIFLLSKADFIRGTLGALCLAARPALVRLTPRSMGRTDTGTATAACLALTSVDDGELTV